MTFIGVPRESPRTSAGAEGGVGCGSSRHNTSGGRPAASPAAKIAWQTSS